MKGNMQIKRISIFCTVLVLVALACQMGTAPLAATQAPSAQSGQPTSSQGVVPGANPVAQQDALVALYQAAIPGVVAIQVTTAQGGALGSGFVFDTQGHIVTNYHVVQGAQNNKVEVDFNSGYKTFGTVVGTDLDSDIALVKVDAPASELHPLTMGGSSAVKVGQIVVAIGNPFGVNGTMVVGCDCAVDRRLDACHTTP